MAKQRTSKLGAGRTGLVFASSGFGTIANTLNPNVSAVPPPAGTAFASGPGKSLMNIHVQLIFWGAWWNSNPLAAQVTSAVTNLLAGPYMTYLTQYGVHRGNLRGTTFAADSEPESFSLADVGAFILKLLDDDRLPEPDEDWPIAYAVVMPLNSSFKGTSPPDILPLAPGTVSRVNGSIVWRYYRTSWRLYGRTRNVADWQLYA
jgi:hypothetical protein